MHKKGLSHLLEPGFRLHFLCLALFALAAAFAGHYALAAVEAVVTLILFLYSCSSALSRS